MWINAMATEIQCHLERQDIAKFTGQARAHLKMGDLHEGKIAIAKERGVEEC